MYTPSATLCGMDIEGSASDRRASEPIVPEALRRSPAERTRTSVIRRSGRDPDSGAPRRDMSWLENTSIAGLKSAVSDCITTPPHCGISQLFPPPSISISPTYMMKLMVGAPPMLGLRGHSAALIKALRSSRFRTLPPTPGVAYSWI